MQDKLQLPAIDAKFLHRLLMQTRNRARRAGILFTLCEHYAERQFAAQHGRCEVTGLEFHLERFPKALVKHPFAPSIDRKRSDLGYTTDNARLVCVGVNFGMGQWGQELYMRLARAAVKHETEGESEPAHIAADDWAAQQVDRIAGAEKVLSLIVDPAERAAQVRHIAALKAHLRRRLHRSGFATDSSNLPVQNSREISSSRSSTSTASVTWPIAQRQPEIRVRVKTSASLRSPRSASQGLDPLTKEQL